MKRELNQFADKYLKEINNENAAIFAGAGLSVASGLVNWKGLLTEIAEELKRRGCDVHMLAMIDAARKDYKRFDKTKTTSRMKRLFEKVSKISRQLKPYSLTKKIQLFIGVSKKSAFSKRYNELNRTIKELVETGVVDDIADKYF